MYTLVFAHESALRYQISSAPKDRFFVASFVVSFVPLWCCMNRAIPTPMLVSVIAFVTTFVLPSGEKTHLRYRF